MRTARQLSYRHLRHLLVAALFTFICSGTPAQLDNTLIGPTRAVEVGIPYPEKAVLPELPPPTPIPVDPDETPLASPTPLPTPVPVDPDATPLAAPPPPPPAPQVATSVALLWPVFGGITQYFGPGHFALDIGASYGSPVAAAQSGTVTWAGWRNNGGGYVVEIDHGNGMVTGYNHLSAVWVVVGQGVNIGDGIGAVGCTGWCTGPHVHFTLVVNGQLVDPLAFL